MSFSLGSLVTISSVIAAFFLFTQPAPAVDWPPELGRYEGGDMPHGMSMDCVLQEFSACSGWIWVCNDDAGAVWGTLYRTRDCPGNCTSSTNVREIYLYTICSSTPAHFGGVGIVDVNERLCPTALLYQSPPMTIVTCTAGNHWTTIETPPVPVSGSFAVTVTWGPRVNGVSNPQFALDEEYADARCISNPGYVGFPGCATSQETCDDAVLCADLRSFIYVTDINHDGKLEDLCALYGEPTGLDIMFPYGYAFWANSMLMGVGLECAGPTALDPGSWGRVKALFR